LQQNNNALFYRDFGTAFYAQGDRQAKPQSLRGLDAAL
jgi:hypothetical protein